MMLGPSTMMSAIINALMSTMMSIIKERLKHKAETHKCGHAGHWSVLGRVGASNKCSNIKRPLA